MQLLDPKRCLFCKGNPPPASLLARNKVSIFKPFKPRGQKSSYLQQTPGVSASLTALRTFGRRPVTRFTEADIQTGCFIQLCTQTHLIISG